VGVVQVDEVTAGVEVEEAGVHARMIQFHVPAGSLSALGKCT
jgi:hypothetical protein